MRSIILFAVLSLSALPALAQSACVEPVAPSPIDGAQASADQLRNAMALARAYMADAEVYQDCLLKEVDAGKTQATASGQPFEPMLETSAQYKVAASRKSEEKVGQAINAAVTAYKQKFP